MGVRPERYNQHKVDAFLEKHAPLRRYASMDDAGLSYANFHLRDEKEVQSLIRFWQEKFTRIMTPAFKVPGRVRTENGPFVNVFEALAGEPECCRRRKVDAKRDVLRIGINLSRQESAVELVAMRGGATMALWNLCKQRGQKVAVEVCYGNGLTRPGILCHVRIGVPHPTVGQITSLCCSDLAVRGVGHKVIDNIPGKYWNGVYRLHEFAAEGFPKEYDFALDRLETSDPKREENRIMGYLKALRLV